MSLPIPQNYAYRTCVICEYIEKESAVTICPICGETLPPPTIAELHNVSSSTETLSSENAKSQISSVPISDACSDFSSEPDIEECSIKGRIGDDLESREEEIACNPYKLFTLIEVVLLGAIPCAFGFAFLGILLLFFALLSFLVPGFQFLSRSFNPFSVFGIFGFFGGIIFRDTSPDKVMRHRGSLIDLNSGEESDFLIEGYLIEGRLAKGRKVVFEGCWEGRDLSAEIKGTFYVREGRDCKSGSRIIPHVPNLWHRAFYILLFPTLCVTCVIVLTILFIWAEPEVKAHIVNSFLGPFVK